jgi:FKBP-type peptidyl-prolyl cis-trans isomerase 2
MQTAQLGDRVQVHYVKHFQDGSTVSSRGRAPLEVTIGEGHSRLPGLGLALVGLAPGASIVVRVSAENAYGPAVAARVRRWARTRFSTDSPLPLGKRIPVLDRQGRPRMVRILETTDKMVVVDTNHRWAGQSLELEVELIGIQCAVTDVQTGTSPGRHTNHLGQQLPSPDEWQDNGGEG